MARLRTDLLATMFGQGWAAAIGLLFVPVYVARLGIEAYGLIALVPLCAAVLQVLDGGLALTLNREMARRVAAPGSETDVRSTAVTLLSVHLLIGVIMGALTLLLLPALGRVWLVPQQISPSDLQSALWLIAVASAIYWPVPLLQNGLVGLGRQPVVNGLIAINATALNAGAAALITFYRADVDTYLAWAIACNAVHVSALALAFRRALQRHKGPGRFERARLREVLSFTGGAAGIGVTGIILTYIDRIVASKLLTLEQFGYYGLAATIGRSIYLLITPVFSAVFPRLSALVARSDREGLEALYGAATQIMAVAIFPAAAVIVWFGFDLGHAWLGNPVTATEIAGIAAVLALGATINGVMHLPYGLQLAHGLTRLGLQVNLVLLAVFVPAAIVLHDAFGTLGIAAAWPLLNAAYFLIAVPLTHRILRFGQPGSWIARDLLPIAVASFAGVGLLHVIVAPGASRLASLGLLLTALGIAYAAAALASSRVRAELKRAPWRRWLQG